MQDLMAELRMQMRLLDAALKEFKERGKHRAECERAYRVAKAEFVTRQRAEGVPVSIVADLAKGDRDIAMLCMKRDIADTLYDSSREAINVFKLKIRTINDQIEREWGNRGE